MCSWGTGNVPLWQAPVESGNTRCMRWLVLSVALPFQQSGKFTCSWSRVAAGHCGIGVDSDGAVAPAYAIGP